MAGGIKRVAGRKLRLFGVLASLAVVAAMVVGGSAAQAAVGTRDSATCVFTGLAGNLTPPIQPATIQGGTGTYNFNGSATCVTTETDDPTPSGAVSGVNSVNITSSGTYANDRCGTGTAQGNSTIGPTTVGPLPEGNISGTGTDLYDITFKGGTGPITWGTGLVDGNNEPILSNGVADGIINITPANAGGCVTQPVSAFSVAGFFTGTT
jgi:hypothetical protein